MSAEYRYEAALSAALSIMRALEAGRQLSPPEKLAQATYTILDAIYQAEECAQGESPALPVSWVGVLPALRCHLGGDPAQG